MREKIITYMVFMILGLGPVHASKAPPNDNTPSGKVALSLEYSSEYILYNLETGEKMFTESDCLIMNDENSNFTNNCRVIKKIALENDSTLIYEVEYKIENIEKLSDSLVGFQFSVIHNYYVVYQNEPDSQMNDDTIRMTTGFKKYVEVNPDQRTEIEIPLETDNLLPFKAREQITLLPPDSYVPLDVSPQMLKMVTPEYPTKAKNEKVQSTVMVRALVNKKGDVVKAGIISCDKPGYGFEDAALESAYRCKYSPGMVEKRPVSVWISYKVFFTLD